MEIQHEVQQASTISLDQIPSEIVDSRFIHPISFSEKDRKAMANKEESGLIDDLEMSDGKILSGKFRAETDKDGTIKFHFFEKKERLMIPRKWGKRDLTHKEVDALKNGDFVGPFKQKSSEYYLKIDKELNSVVVKFPHQTDAQPPQSIGGYKLNALDKNLLANGKQMPTRVFLSNDGKVYFMGNYFIDAASGEKGLHNAKIIRSREKALELMDKYNNTSVSLSGGELESIANTVVEASQNTKEVTQEKAAETAIDKSFGDVKLLVDSADVQKLSSMNEKGFTPDEKLCDYISRHPGLNPDDKAHILMALGKDLKETQSILSQDKSSKRDAFFENINDNMKEYHDNLLNKQRNPSNAISNLPRFDEAVIARGSQFLNANQDNPAVKLYHAIGSFNSKSVATLCTTSSFVEGFHLGLISHLSKSLNGQKLSLSDSNPIAVKGIDSKLAKLSDIEKTINYYYNKNNAAERTLRPRLDPAKQSDVQPDSPENNSPDTAPKQNAIEDRTPKALPESSFSAKKPKRMPTKVSDDVKTSNPDISINKDKSIDVDPIKNKSGKGAAVAKSILSGLDQAGGRVAGLMRDS